MFNLLSFRIPPLGTFTLEATPLDFIIHLLPKVEDHDERILNEYEGLVESLPISHLQIFLFSNVNVGLDLLVC